MAPLNLRQIGVAVDHLKNALVSEKDRHDKAVALIRRDLKQVQAACPHPRIHHFLDPAGGVDLDECELCGHQVH